MKEPSMQPPSDAPGTNLTTAKTKARLRLDEIKLSTQVTKKQVLADWGPPDAIEGFGVEYLVYKLEDGRLLWLRFDSDARQSLLGALLFTSTRDTRGKIIFDGKEATSVR